MTTATLRRPEAEILDSISQSPLGLQMTQRWGWDRSKFGACLDFAVRLKAAIQADRRQNGPRVQRLQEEFRRSFGATDSDLAMLTYVDRNWHKEGFSAGHGASEEVKQAEYVAMLLVTEIAD